MVKKRVMIPVGQFKKMSIFHGSISGGLIKQNVTYKSMFGIKFRSLVAERLEFDIDICRIDKKSERYDLRIQCCQDEEDFITYKVCDLSI